MERQYVSVSQAALPPPLQSELRVQLLLLLPGLAVQCPWAPAEVPGRRRVREHLAWPMEPQGALLLSTERKLIPSVVNLAVCRFL